MKDYLRKIIGKCGVTTRSAVVAQVLARAYGDDSAAPLSGLDGLVDGTWLSTGTQT